MVKYDGVLKRVREMEEKKGVVYAKPDGRLYKVLRIFFLLAFMYNFFMNLCYIAGMFLYFEEGIYKSTDNFSNMITILVLTALSIAGLVLLYCKIHSVSALLNTLPIIATLFVYGPLLKPDGTTLSTDIMFGYKEVYFWRHLIPVTVLLVLAVWLAVIALRAKKIGDNMYKKVVDDLFEIYKNEHKDEEIVSAEGWEEYLKNYTPESFKKETKKKAKKAKKNSDAKE